MSSLESQTTVANQSAEVQSAQARTDKTSSTQQQNQETAEKLNKIPTQNQTSEASKGQSVLSQKENVRLSCTN